MPELQTGQIDRYPITRILGEGGMGVVYLCRDDIGRPVAIKTLKGGLPENVKRRFKEEGNRGDLNHDNIVTIYTVSPESVDPPYIVMEYLDGDPLDQLITGGNRLTMAEKLDVIGQVCKGLDYAHSKGVIHRDIKPANIIRLRDSGRIKIVDFGISKVKREFDTAGLSQTQGIIGTVGYIAPERWLNRLEDGRVDIFSTGVMLYFLVTGREPFVDEAGEGPAPVMQRILNEPYPPLSLYLKDYPEELTNILDRALAKEPSDRYYTGMEFADDLAVLVDELSRRRIPQLLDESQRYLTDGAWQQALDRCQEVLKIDPQNSGAKQLKESAQQGRKAQDIELKIQRLLAEAEELLENKRYDDAIRIYQEVDRQRPGVPQYQARLQAAKDKKVIHDQVEDLIRRAAMEERAGDLTGPLQMYRQADQLAPNNIGVLREIDRLNRRIEEEESRKKNERHIFNAEQKIASRQFTEALEVLDGVRRSRIGHEKLDALYEEALRGRDRKEAGRLKEQFETQATKYRYAQQYEPALAEVDRGLKVLPGDTALVRLRQEILSELNEHQQSKWIDETVEAIQNESLSSIEKALVTLREAMRTTPGVERFVSLESTLLTRQAQVGSEMVRAECLRRAGEGLTAGRPESSIQIIESYLLKHPDDPDVEGLLQEARRALEQQRLRTRISECAGNARTLLEQGRFDDAVGVLQPVYSETRDGELAALLERATQEKAKVDSEVRQLARHVTELRRDGKLKEAIELIEAQPARTLQSPALGELLEALKKERTRDEALAGAIARAKKAVEASEWARAAEPLLDMRRVFGEFEALTRALAGFESLRTREADRVAGESVTTANAAVLAGDKKAAVRALRIVSAAIPYATAAVAQDWKNRATEFDVPIVPESGSGQPQARFPVWAMGVAALVVAIVAGVIWYVTSNRTSITITGAPAGAAVQIGDSIKATADGNGQVSVKVDPGTYKIDVILKDWSPYSQTVPITKGSTVTLPVQMLQLDKTGILIADGNVESFELFVGDKSLGEHKRGEHIPLLKGDNQTIAYEAKGFARSPDKLVNISGAPLNDTFKLVSTAVKIDGFNVPPSVPDGGGPVKVNWKTSNAKTVTLQEGNKPPETVDKEGQRSFQVTQETKFILRAEGDEGGTVEAPKSVRVLKADSAQVLDFSGPKAPVKAGDEITLTYKTNFASRVEITHDGGKTDFSTTRVQNQKDSSATFRTPLGATGNLVYNLSATGAGGNDKGTITVAVVAPPPPIKTTTPADASPVTNGTAAAGTSGTPPSDTAKVEAPKKEPGEAPIPRIPPVQKDVLDKAVTGFGNKIAGALHAKDEKGCKAALNGLYGMVSPGLKTPLDSLGRRCGDIKTAIVRTPNCSSPKQDSSSHATMLCDLTISLSFKSGGDDSVGKYPGSNFSFAKNASDEGWNVERWEFTAH